MQFFTPRRLSHKLLLPLFLGGLVIVGSILAVVFHSRASSTTSLRRPR